MTYDSFYQKRGATPSHVESWSHYNRPIPHDGKPHGNSRRHGDASEVVQRQTINTIIAECARRGLSKEDAAHVLAIARVESGFNPDAAAGQTSASGLGQFINKTGARYGLNDANRFDLEANTRALVEHYLDNKSLAQSRGKDSSWIYKYHHDGPALNSGGLQLAQKEVVPYAKAYSASTLLAELGTRAKAFANEVGHQAREVFTDIKHRARAIVAEVKHYIEPILGSRHAPAIARPVVESTHHAVPAEEPSTASALTSAALAQGLSHDAIKALVAHRFPDGMRDATEQLAALDAAKAVATRYLEAGPHGNPGELMVAKALSHARGIAYAVEPSQPAGAIVSLEQALTAHMTEKGFDAHSVAKAPALARMISEDDGHRGPDASALVLHREGEVLASVASRREAQAFATAGESVLAMDKLEAVARHGLDTDAVAFVRGLAPERTAAHTDLEVFQAAPANLAHMALHSDDSHAISEKVKELVAALPAMQPNTFAQDPSAPQQVAAAEKSATAPSVGMELSS